VASGPAEVRRPVRILTDHELQLTEQLEQAREHVDELQAKLNRLTETPLAGAREWARRRRARQRG
jgi:hypothetical protein